MEMRISSNFKLLRSIAVDVVSGNINRYTLSVIYEVSLLPHFFKCNVVHCNIFIGT